MTTAPQSREELLALPVVAPPEGYLGLAVIKVEGTYAACDDDGNWWGIEPMGESGWSRRILPCKPVDGL